MKNTFANTKVGLLVGTVMSAVVVLYVLLSPSRGPVFRGHSGSDILFFVISTIFPALLGGAISGSIIELFIVRKYIFRRQFLLDCKTGCIIGSIVGGLVSYPVGAFLGVVFGSMFGGGIGSVIGTKIGMENSSIPIGIALGMLTVIVLITVIGALISLFVGFTLHTIVRQFTKFVS